MATGADHCRLHARLTPRKVFASDLAKDRSHTFEEFDQLIGQFGTALSARSVKPGDRVAVLSRNRVECVLTHLACAQLGAIYVPLNWRLSPAEVTGQVADAEPMLVMGDTSLAAAGLSGLNLDNFAIEAAAQPPKDFNSDADRPSLILYTSGTSGKPKGALLSERNIEQTAINFSLLGRITHQSVFLCDAPMFHVLGLITNIRPALMRGGSIVISDGFNPARTLDRLSDQRLSISHYFCVPQMAAALRAEPGFAPNRLRHLTAIFTGGAPHPAANIRAWVNDGLVIVDGFGMSEAGTVFGMPLDPELIAAHAGSAGLRGPGIRSRIVDSRERDCPVGEPGELLLKGENITCGYWRKPEETVAAFTDDGWFRTGDVVRADADGYHWIVDRRKDLFISGGENIYPAEIEAALAGHPHVAECAVVGVPDERWGEVGHLFVVTVAGSNPDTSELLAHIETRIARFKVPKHVSFIPELPRNGAGKVIKPELRRLARP